MRLRMMCMQLALAVTLAGTLGSPVAATATERWEPPVLAVASRMLVQEGGRVKPLGTLARFMLLDLSGQTRLRDVEGHRHTSLEWFLDVWLYPERADEYPVFLVQTSAVLDAIGLPHEGKRKRDRYSYTELRPGRDRLFELAEAYSHIDAKERDHIQGQIVNLGHALSRYESLRSDLDFARTPLTPAEQALVTDLLSESKQAAPGSDTPGTDRSRVTVVGVLERTPQLMQVHEVLSAGAPGDPRVEQLARLLRRAWTQASLARGMATIPPPGPRDASPEWLTSSDVFSTLVSGPVDPATLALVRDLEEMAQRRDDVEAFRAALLRFHDGVDTRARMRGEAGKSGLEVFLYEAKVLQRSLILYLVGFVLAAIGWLATRSPWPYRAANLFLVLGTAALVVAIVLRCIIRSRPPVSTLYETILFITAISVGTALFIELVNRQRIAQGLAAILGIGGLFLAGRYEALEGLDTMPSLVAVLDTNFWLSTHVTTITMGYAAGLLASAFAHVYVLGRLFGRDQLAAPHAKSLVRMIYGVICFGLIFSVVGTILGGVWANESWGRFWGWDPKENGALMIVLWQLFILHARMGGYIRDLGIAVAAIFGGMIVAFSWWGVNLLGIGLHSYGFTSGVMRALMIFYIVETCVLGGAAVLAWRGRARSQITAHP